MGAAGQPISFDHTDGRKVSLTIPPGVVPGQTLQVNIPDPPAASKGKGKAPAKKKKRRKSTSDDDDDDESDDEFVPGRDDRDESDYPERSVEPAEEDAPALKRPRRSSAAKATEKFTREVTDEQFENALKAQQKFAEDKAVREAKAKEERAKQRQAQALLLAKVAAEADAVAEAEAQSDEECEIENIVDVKKGPLGLVYEIKWKGGDQPEDNTWEPEANLHPELVADFKRDYPELIKQAQEGDCEIEVVLPKATGGELNGSAALLQYARQPRPPTLDR